MKVILDRKFCVAPMMGYTTPYARKLYRILSKRSFLFTEMIAAKTLIYSKNKNLIIENDNHNPVSLQVGGSEIKDLKKSSRIACDYNYDEINLNVGCPSKAVLNGRFGACLMKDKKLVRNCLESMQNGKIEVTMKCRIGLGKEQNYEFFEEFIDEVVMSGISIIYIHARNAILSGISPKANRNIPPLNYNFVKKIKKKYHNIKFIINGGIDSLDKAYKLSQEFDGVMIGRLIQNNPFVLKHIDKNFYNDIYENICEEEIIKQYFDYIRPKTKEDSVFRLLSPILQIFFGLPKSKLFKTKVNQLMKDENLEVIQNLFEDFVINQKLSVS